MKYLYIAFLFLVLVVSHADGACAVESTKATCQLDMKRSYERGVTFDPDYVYEGVPCFVLSGRNIKSWSENGTHIMIRLTASGMKTFEILTTERVRKKTVIFIADLFVSAPFVMEPIHSGGMSFFRNEEIISKLPQNKKQD